MRRPLSHGCAAMLVLVVAATPALAQRERVIRQAFAPAITPLFGTTGFGHRVTDANDGAAFDYANSFAVGVQLDRPLTRRAGVLATLTVTPLTRVVRTFGPDVIDYERAVVGGLDLGIAGRLKPAAPLFVYVGGGAVLATKRAVVERGGFGADPRATLGVGIDLMRFERSGFRLLYMGHWVKPGTPDASRWPAKSTAFDQTVAIGGRLMLGTRETAP